jgi:hypothetical protein
MPTDAPEFAPIPAWIDAIGEEFVRLSDSGSTAAAGTYRQMYGFLMALEIEEFARPRCEVLGPHLVRLSWANGRKSLRFECGPGHVHITTSHPDPRRTPPGRGQLVNAARATFDWYRPARTSTPKDRP